MIVRSGKTPWIGARDGLGSEPESTAEGALSAGSLGWQALERRRQLPQ